MSGAFLDMAMGVNAPVVPIRFVGALPQERMDQRLEFPVGMGRQDIYIGRPVLPEELAGLHYGARKQKIIEAINALGPSNADEIANPGDPAFADRVAAWQEAHGVSEEHAVLGCVLQGRRDPSPDTTALFSAAADTDLKPGPVSDWLAKLGHRIGRWTESSS
jgi:hypothetical protein